MDKMPDLGANQQQVKKFIDDKLHFLQTGIDESDTSKWPKVNVPYDIEIDSKVFYYDWEEKELESLRDMTIKKWVDSTGNRALSIVNLNAPLIGNTECQTFTDFTKQLMVKAVKDRDYCEEIELPERVNLRSLIDKLKKEGGGMVRYIGDRKAVFDRETVPTIYHGFRLDIDCEKWGMKASLIYLFDMESGDLRYVELIKPFFLVFDVQNGLSERKFTDEDFKGVLTKCPRSSKNGSLEIPELEPLGFF